jgi:hypothetical protein
MEVTYRRSIEQEITVTVPNGTTPPETVENYVSPIDEPADAGKLPKFVVGPNGTKYDVDDVHGDAGEWARADDEDDAENGNPS